MILFKIIFIFLAIYFGLFFLTLIISFCTKWCIILRHRYLEVQELKEKELKQRNYIPKKVEKKKTWNENLGVWEID